MTEWVVDGWGILKWSYGVIRDFWDAAVLLKIIKTASYYHAMEGGAHASNLPSDDIRKLSFLEKRGLIDCVIEGKRRKYFPTEYGLFLLAEFEEEFDRVYKEIKELVDRFYNRLEEYSRNKYAKEVDEQ